MAHSKRLHFQHLLGSHGVGFAVGGSGVFWRKELILIQPTNSGSGSGTNLPTELVIASIVSIVAVSALAVLVYMKKRKNTSGVLERERTKI